MTGPRPRPKVNQNLVVLALKQGPASRERISTRLRLMGIKLEPYQAGHALMHLKLDEKVRKAGDVIKGPNVTWELTP